MADTYFFEIPVYAWSQEDHRREQATVRDEWTSAGREMGQNDSEHYGELGVSIQVGYPWQYNCIVGWLRIMADGSSIKTYVWWTKAQRIRHKPTMNPPAHVYEQHHRQIAELHVRYQSSADIYEALLDDIRSASKERPLRGSYVDLSCFLATGPHVDWCAALDNAPAP